MDSGRNRKSQEHNKGAYYGDAPGPTAEWYLRVGSVNLDNVSPYSNPAEDKLLADHIQYRELDCLLVQEVGVNWSQVAGRHRWKQRLEKHFSEGQIRAKLSYNKHDNTCHQKQWGGTGILSQGKLTHFTESSTRSQTQG